MDEKIAQVVDRFDFDKVIAYMTITDWKVQGRIPDKKLLTFIATELLGFAIMNPGTMYQHRDYGLVAIDARNPDYSDLAPEGLFLYFYIEHKKTISL